MNRRRAHICVVGSLNMDVVVEAPRQPRMGETLLGKNVHFIPGGKGANQAVAAARLGAKTSMIGLVGNDPFGDSLLTSLRENGVEAASVKAVTGATGVASILLAERDNCIIVVPGANAHLTPEYLEANRDRIEEADVVLLQLEIPLETVAAAAHLAKKLGKRVILNPAPAQDLPEELLRDVDVITPNFSELERLSSISAVEEGLEVAMSHLAALGAVRVVTTLGQEGAALRVPGKGVVRIPAQKVKVVDTTGAGDAFNAGLACSLAEEKDWIEAVDFAVKTASLAVTRLGAQAGMPSREEVESYFLSQESSSRHHP
ncbi:ribokinase [Desmospora profundinema]|uniref:Ribokinase n=1 Tax=Desmospora profundinema TaxID=1571184 RepID=A0ABU1IKX2_9BACL|nr:ribokinase [Desmospora profundinema]MDR6225425.1 ribokinase [Desmospora profundinema]